MELEILRISAFTSGKQGGNPAGVLLCDTMPSPEVMQSIAAEVGYSETVFAAKTTSGFRVRYFAPTSEVDFCGHATIALGAALARRFGNGTYDLELNETVISVDGYQDADTCFAVLRSPPTGIEALSFESLTAVLQLFGYPPEVLDLRIAPAIISAGSRFLLMPLASRESLRAMRYDFEQGQRFMNHLGITTVMIVFPETAQLFHSRNAFASGGVYEDAATGAASAAFAGYLRDIDWPHGGSIVILQGEDMGSPSRIYVEVPLLSESPIRVSGAAQFLDA